MFLRRRSQRVRHTNSDSMLVRVNKEVREDSELDALTDSFKHTIQELTAKGREKLVRCPVPLRRSRCSELRFLR